MATTIKLKNSVTTTNAPSSLVQGEVAINITDKKVWVGNAATTPIQLLGDGGSASFTSIAFGAGTVSNPSITFTGDTNTGIYSPAADTIAFTEGGVEAMRIDSSGNVGIGNTPSGTSATGYRSLELGTTAGTGITAGNGDFYVPVNAYVAGGAWKYATTSTASLLNIQGGLFTWSNAGSGTAGNNISFSERMRITSGGEVLVGTTSATAGKLAVKGSDANTLWLVGRASDGTSSVSFRNNADSAYNARIECFDTGVMTFATGTSATERMRITSSGQVCINTTAAVVDANSKFVVSNKVASGVAAEFSNNVSGTACVLINNEGAATSTLINWYAANAFRSSVTWNGTNIIYGTPSDQRLKENIVDSNSALPLINDIKIRSFDWKENGNHIEFGVIAQELESVMPEAVLKGKDNEDGSIKESWSVDTSTLVPALIKAIQEQQAMIEELKQEVDKLKGV